MLHLSQSLKSIPLSFFFFLIVNLILLIAGEWDSALVSFGMQHLFLQYVKVYPERATTPTSCRQEHTHTKRPHVCTCEHVQCSQARTHGLGQPAKLVRRQATLAVPYDLPAKCDRLGYSQNFNAAMTATTMMMMVIRKK